MKFFHKAVGLTVFAAVIGLDLSTRAQSTPPGQLTLRGIDLRHKTGRMQKVGTALASMHAARQSSNTRASQSDTSLLVHGDKVVVDAVASGNPTDLLNDLKRLGLQQASMHGSIISGLLPIESIDEMAQLNSLRFARPAYAHRNVGLTTSQGDLSMRADVARNDFGVDGTGVTVGVLSDSFNVLGGAAADVESGDLPPNVNVLEEDLFPGNIDEGRAMLQLIHDVAPGAKGAFHTARLGQASFANGIIRLADDAGADVIVDDVIYIAEPMFQDGIIAQAVDSVVSKGVSYFSSAGNLSRRAYESAFNPSGQIQAIGEFHDFDPGPEVDVTQSVTVPPGATLTLSFQWDSPFFSVSPGSGGSPNDIDIYLVDDSGFIVASSTDSNFGGDAVEILNFSNQNTFGEPGTTTQFNLVIANYRGPNPGLMKYVNFGSSRVRVNEFDTASGSSYGHSNARGAEGVGAAPYYQTPPFGVSPAVLESFSSAGPTQILFDLAGNRLHKPEILEQPDIVAPDGTNTTFFPPLPLNQRDVESDGFPNFFGTSASAPHAAAVAALMLDALPDTSPSTIYSTLESTALDMNDPGFDFDSGFGFVQADRAVGALLETSVPPQ